MRTRPLSLWVLILNLYSINATPVERNCAELLGPDFSTSTPRFLAEDLPKGMEISKFRKVVRDVDSMCAGLVIPDNVSVTIKADGKAAGFQPRDFTIQVVANYADQVSEAAIHPKYRLAIFAHEYSHAVFEKNMAINSSLWNETRRVFDAIPGETAEINKQLGELTERYRSQLSNPDIKARFFTEQTALFSVMKVLNQKQKIYLMANTLSSAYHELFADFVPTLYYEDPKVMYRILLDPEMTVDQRWVRYRNRNFSKPYRPVELSQWAERMKTDLSENQYVALAPARGELWRAIQRLVNSGSIDKPKTVKSFFTILKNSYEKALSKLLSGHEINWLEINADLGDQFQTLLEPDVNRLTQ